MRGGMLPTIISKNTPHLGIGIKSKYLSGYDVLIMDNDMKKLFTWLSFGSPDDIDKLIALLEETKDLWEREE